MKFLSPAICSILLLTATAKADYYSTLTEGNQFTIPAGYTALVVYASIMSSTSPGSITYTTAQGSSIIRLSDSQSSTGGAPSTNMALPLVGPATISVADSYGPSFNAALGLKIVETVFSSKVSTAVEGVPSNAVVIPEATEGAPGSVNIILETSADLVTWTAASPGTYSGDTAKRFFRVRAVRNN